MTKQSDKPSLQLQWEWPAGRSPAQKILMAVESVKPEKRGLFGIRRSPSIGDSYIDATIVEGRIIEGPDVLKAARVRIRAPKAELADVAAGDIAAAGLIGSDLLICFEPVPASDRQGDLSGWLSSWQCGDG